MSDGGAYWGGAYATRFWIDRRQEMVGILTTRVRPYTHLDIRRDFLNLAYQALVE